MSYTTCECFPVTIDYGEATLLVKIQSVLDGEEGSNVYFDNNGEAFTRGVAHLVHGQIPVRRYKL